SPDTGNLVARIYALANSEDVPEAAAAAPAPMAAPAPAPVAAEAAAPAAPAGKNAKVDREIDIHIGPIDNPALADGIAELFRDIPGLGSVSAMACDQPGKRVFRARTAASDSELMDLFTFHVSKEQIQIHPAGDVVHGKMPMPPATEGKDYGFYEGAPGLPGAPTAQATAAAARETRAAEARANAAGPAAAVAGAGMESTTLRVSVSKVDQ